VVEADRRECFITTPLAKTPQSALNRDSNSLQVDELFLELRPSVPDTGRTRSPTVRSKSGWDRAYPVPFFDRIAGSVLGVAHAAPAFGYR
jgi:hypothetical protein